MDKGAEELRIIEEPELTAVLEEMERRGIDPMAFLEFVGEWAVTR